MIQKAMFMAALMAGSVLSAGTITFASEGSAVDGDEINNMGMTLAIAKHPGWAAPLAGSSWVSYAETGNPGASGYTVVGNGVTVHFFDTVFVSGGVQFATVTFRADDSAALYVNGVLVQAEASQSGNTYSTCSDFPVGCLAATEVTKDITAYMHTGANKLQFTVAQRAGSSFGLNYGGYVTTIPTELVDVADTPEPASLLLFGAGLIALGCFRRK